MQRKQILILWLGVAFLVVAGIYPPWIEAAPTGNSRAYKPAGYALLFSPSEPGRTIINYSLETTRNDPRAAAVRYALDPLEIPVKSINDVWQAIYGPDASYSKLKSVLDQLPVDDKIKANIWDKAYEARKPLRVPPDTEILNQLSLRVDYGRLFVEWFVIALIAAVMMVTSRAKAMRAESKSAQADSH